MSKSESIIKNTKAEILNSLKSDLQVITETGKDGEVYLQGPQGGGLCGGHL